MKVLVNGVSGRLGPFVVKDMEAAGHEVVMFSRREPVPEIKHLPWVQGDINVYEDCLRALESGGFDAIQHVAAQPNPTDHPEQRKRSAELGLPFDTTMRSNIMGLYYMLQAALANDVEIFVMTGSNCALGHGYRISDKRFPFQYFPVDEVHPSDVEDAYSYSKLAGEMLLASYTSAYDMRTYAVRAAGICNEERRRAIAANVKPVEGWNPWLWAWVGSEDVASAQRLLMEKAYAIAPHGVFFCNGNDTTVLEPSREIIRKYRPDLLPMVRDLDGNDSFLSNQKLRQTVGWEHMTSWRQYLGEEG